jgi:hypothetical protein
LVRVTSNGIRRQHCSPIEFGKVITDLPKNGPRWSGSAA